MAFIALTCCAAAGWLPEFRVNTVTIGKQASRGADCPWSMTCGPDGRLHLVWEDKRSQRDLRIYYRGKSPSPFWDSWDAAEVNISEIDSSLLHGHPSIGALADGSLITVFVEERAGDGELLGACFSALTASWQQPHFVSLPGGNRLTYTSTGWQTTVATNGQLAITFWPYTGPELGYYRPIFYRRWLVTGWESDEHPLCLPGCGLEYDAKNLSAAWGDSDRVYLVFSVMPDGVAAYNICFVELSFSSGAIRRVEMLTHHGQLSQEYPYVCVLEAVQGGFDAFVVFTERDGATRAKLRFSHYGTSQWSAAIDIAPESLSSGYPSLAPNPVAGTVELVFEMPSGAAESQIYHRSFFPGADTFGPITRISEDTLASIRPVVACDRFGNVHVAYISNRVHPDEPGNEEVYYRMFDAPPPAPTNVTCGPETLRWEYPELPDLRHFQVFRIVGGDTVLIGGTGRQYFRHNLGPDALLAVRAVDQAFQCSPLAVGSTSSEVSQQYATPEVMQVSNYPNPFNGRTAIRLPDAMVGNVVAEIYDVTGALVKRLPVTPGQKWILWDGTDEGSQPVASGIYLYRIGWGNTFVQSGRMVLIR